MKSYTYVFKALRTPIVVQIDMCVRGWKKKRPAVNALTQITGALFISIHRDNTMCCTITANVCIII